jgi:hypothetical protein
VPFHERPVAQFLQTALLNVAVVEQGSDHPGVSFDCNVEVAVRPGLAADDRAEEYGIPDADGLEFAAMGAQALEDMRQVQMLRGAYAPLHSLLQAKAVPVSESFSGVPRWIEAGSV